MSNTLEITQEFSGKTGTSLGRLGFRRSQQPGQICSLQVLLVDGGIQKNRVGPTIHGQHGRAAGGVHMIEDLSRVALQIGHGGDVFRKVHGDTP
jgi:hypothetical protein